MKRHYVGRTTCDKCTIPPAPYCPSAESLKTVEICDIPAMWTLGARTDQDRSGQITPKTLKIVGKINNSTNTASKHSKEEIRSGNFRITFQRLYFSGIEMKSLDNVGNVRYQVWLEILVVILLSPDCASSSPLSWHNAIAK